MEIVRDYNKYYNIFKTVAVTERKYLSENKRFEILQFRWGIIGGGQRDFSDINRLTGTKKSRQVYEEIMQYFREKGYVDHLPSCGVYFIRGEHTPLVRIGKSANVFKRLSEHQSGSPVRLWIDYVIGIRKEIMGKYETSFLRWFTSVHSHGSWYRISEEDYIQVKECSSTEDVDAWFSTDSSRLSGNLNIGSPEDKEDEGYNKKEENERTIEMAREFREAKGVTKYREK